MNDQNILNKVLQEINQSLQTTDLDKIDNGLYSGSSGILLADGFHNYYTKGESIFNEEKFDQLTNKLFNSINNPEQGATFSGGLSGQLWSLYHLRSHGYMDVDDSVFEEYSEYLNNSLIAYAKAEQWDNLHGAFGILYYLNYTNTLSEKHLINFLDLYQEKAYNNGKFEFYKTKATITSDDMSYNFSLSHGLSGQILILSYLLKNRSLYFRVIEILMDMVEFVVGYKKNNVEKGSIFPSTLNELEDQADADKSRLAWCYGDLGTCYSLYRFAKESNNTALEKEMLDSLESLSKKRGIKENGIFDSPLCHGTTGVMQIFHRLYFETGLDIFNDASDYWLKESLSFYTLSNSFITMGAWRYDVQNFIPNEGILEGYAGVNLAILAKLNPGLEPSWDGCLFLS